MKEQQCRYEYTTSCGVCYLCTILAGGGVTLRPAPLVCTHQVSLLSL